MSKLLLIESPGKLRKLSQILGPGWTVKASMGHVRELANDGEDSLGFDLGLDPSNTHIDCRYIPRSPRAKKVLSELRQAAKNASQVYIATDPDREGETIGWHIQQALRLKNPQRVTYSEITAAAVKKALANPTHLNQDLVAAGRARDCLDKLVGYKGSRHVVWPLNNGAKSMGRVQSATLHLICQREREIIAFKPEDYWSIWSQYGEGFKAFYCKDPSKKKTAPAKKAEKGSKAAKPDSPESDRVSSQAEADRILQIARNHPHIVISVEGKTTHQSPPPPFITSSLQQSAGARLKLSPEGTMKIAQSLYEAGHITYMRTDSVVLAAPFKADVRTYLQQNDPQNLPQQATGHRGAAHKNSKNAQEAHEAIRPTKVGQTPATLANQLSGDQAKLYELIWNRAVASLCAPVRLRKTRVITQAGTTPTELAYWEARGQVVEFPGYTRYWNNLKADSQLPELKIGQTLNLSKAQADKKQTQPPPRYSEPKLIQLMERKGIGRPSTYAPTLKTLRDRTYVTLVAAKKQGKLQPTALGMSLDGALEQLLPDLIQPDFTAQMEAKLDAIAQGQENWERYLTGWYQTYFSPAINQAQRKMGQVLTQQANQPAFTPAVGRTAETSSKASGKAPSNRRASNATAESRSHRSQATVSKTACPKCSALLQKIPSKSKKLQANHFLKCESPGCETVMFWNKGKKAYEQPYAQRSPDPANFTNHPCPSCGALLERYSYSKDGQDKTMLRCSVFENRKGKCQDVAYFHSRDEYWSPKYGVLGAEEAASQAPAASSSPSPRRAKATPTKRTSNRSARKPKTQKTGPKKASAPRKRH